MLSPPQFWFCVPLPLPRAAHRFEHNAAVLRFKAGNGVERRCNRMCSTRISASAKGDTPSSFLGGFGETGRQDDQRGACATDHEHTGREPVGPRWMSLVRAVAEAVNVDGLCLLVAEEPASDADSKSDDQPG